MPLTRLDNLYSSKTGKYLYVSPDDFNATDELDNRGNSPLRPFKTIQRAFIEVSRYSYLPGKDNDRFDQFSIMLMPGNHYIDNRPGLVESSNPEQRYIDAANLADGNRREIIDRSAAEIAIQYPDFYYPGDPQTGTWSVFKDSYRLIQLNRQEIINNSYTSSIPGDTDGEKCKRDIGYFIDAVSLDIAQGGGNVYTRKFIKNYFNQAGTSWISQGLQGEESQSITAFEKARDEMVKAITNLLTVKDLTITGNVAGVSSAINALTVVVTDVIDDGNLSGLPAESVSENVSLGEVNAKKDIAFVVDSIIADLRTGGNSNIISASKSYFDRSGNLITTGFVGQQTEPIAAFNKAKEMLQKSVTNQLYFKDFSIQIGPSFAGDPPPSIAHSPSGNPDQCVDVQNTINTLMGILVDVIDEGSLENLASVQITGTIPVFNYNRALEEWQDDSILDLSNPDNVLYKFNSSSGGAIVPRGCSLIGYDLRRTIVRPLYVPDPVDGSQARTSIFNLTGGCYLWQFTIKDGDLSENSPLYNPTDRVGKVYAFKGNTTNLAVPEYSHHKITIMTYADNEELDRYYEKVGRAFVQFQPSIDDGDFEALVQENRIVGPLSDTRTIESIKVQDVDGGNNILATVTTKIDHGYFPGQYVALINTDLNDELNGTFKVQSIDQENPKIFTYKVLKNSSGVGLVNGQTYTIANGLGTNAIAQAEIDSVESASPYVFNCSIRSTWGLCGMWADGSKATGFKSMVVAQYTGVSLQRDDRAFIRYDRFTNTWNQASLLDAFATVPYHAKGDAYWKDDWRNFHIRASDDSFIQCVSVFAVGFHDHFLMESGGDMSITNSNSNFGNTSLHAIGFKGFAFNQDKGGYVTDIIPPKIISDSRSNATKNQYYTLDIRASNDVSNNTKLYIGSDDARDPEDRPAATINRSRIGVRTDERIYVKLDPISSGGSEEFYSTLDPTGFKIYTASLETLNPGGFVINNKAQDAADRIQDNKTFIQQEAYQYVLEKFPSVAGNPNITISKCFRDIGYFVDAVVQDLRVGGNINTIQAAEGYLIGGQLAYINNELTETLETYDYVKNICIAAMRNFDYLIKNCDTTSGSAIVDVGDTTGLTIGMRVNEYNPNAFVDSKLVSGATPITSNIPAGTYIKRIVDSSRIELGQAGSRLNTGNTVNALQNSTSAFLYFVLEEGVWASLLPLSDPTLVQDTAYPECADIATTITAYFNNISLILNGNGSSVIRVESTVDVAALARRATLFTINTGGGTSNPHQFETGTAVRLLPRAKANTIVDKRLVRLPLGFNTNQKYYVIAPGRDTSPENFAGTTSFDGSDQTKLMLAATKENAAAGIYIYSPETDFVDDGIEIVMQQYVLDSTYDLHKYRCNLAGAGEIETEVAHIFDVPAAGVEPQKIFFRVASDIVGSNLPEISGSATINTQVYYYARYVTNEKFSVHLTQADAIAGVNSINFVPGSGADFYVFANKRTSPLKFDPEYKDISTNNTTGLWYLQVKDESSGGLNPQSILSRFKANDYDDASGKIRTTDTWFERINDERAKEDRVYRLRYVIPSYLETVRNPLNGFTLKVRTDDRRRLLPQRIQLRPIGAAPSIAKFYNPVQANEVLGFTEQKLLVEKGVAVSTYDPYSNPKVIEFDSKIATTVQSAKTITVSGTEYLELITFDHTILNQQLKNEIFTVVKVAAAQGGSFVTNKFASNTANFVTWTGFSNGSGYIHAYYTVDSQNYLILKNITGQVKFSFTEQTIFTQGNVFSALSSPPNSAGDPSLRDKSDTKNYLYRVAGANVYTLVPGDTITDDESNQYVVQSVQDVGEIEDTFYIFDINQVQERIAGQQDGIYYLTCLRGNISPFPTGPGVGENFKKYKFSQPIGQLYPLSYRNDPLWFQVRPDGTRDTSIVDPPEATSAADNYIHGLVTINDNKNSETKESTLDFLKTSALSNYQYTDSYIDPLGENLDNRIRAQEGNATSGSEDRRIIISGDSPFPTERKLYVELRRPSIARSGNHTFEYLGFGPGNYSTGFPLRQEVVLTDKQDFYAQSKKEDGGIVFYTGLNSNGDLYIGNRKINAITGEETFLERAILEESEDDLDNIGSLVTTFDTPVTFNDKITVEGDSFFNNPVEINVDPLEGDSLRIYSKVLASDDPTLDRSSFRDPRNGDILLTKNKIKAAIFALNPRGNISQNGQTYTIKTHYAGGAPSNITPNQNNHVSAGGDRFYPAQVISYGNSEIPKPGDIVLRGEEVGKSGSLGWVYANYYTTIQDSEIFTITTDGSSTVTIQWKSGLSNNSLNVKAGEFLRISNFSNSLFNGVWTVLSDGFVGSAATCKIQIQNALPVNVYSWSDESPGATIEISRSNWKETWVLGAESIRTRTEVAGDYRVGINTIARAAHDAALEGNVSEDTDPKANLDIVGTTFISGKVAVTYDANGLVSSNVYLSEPSHTKPFIPVTNAFLVGGNSANPNDYSTLRVSTTDVAVGSRTPSYRPGGRFGINTSIGLNASTELDRNFVVIGDGRISGNFKIQDDISVDGGDINSTSSVFNFLNQNVEIVNALGRADIINLGSNTTGTQNLNIGNAASTQIIEIGGSAIETSFNVHKNSLNARVDIASVGDASANRCSIVIGGAWNNTSSTTTIGTRQTKVAGELEIGTKYAAGTSSTRLFTQTRNVSLFDGDQTTTVNFATNASEINIASLGGNTTVRNTLNVLASANVNGNIRLIGGLNAGIIEIQRGRFGTTPSAHIVGSLANPNIDFYKYTQTGKKIDTQGVGFWGGTSYLVSGGQIAAIDNLVNAGAKPNRTQGQYNFVVAEGGTGEGATFNITVFSDGSVSIELASPGVGYSDNDLLTIRDQFLGSGGAPNITFNVNGVNAAGSNYVLPITTPTANDFRIGDLVLIDRGNANSPNTLDTITNLRDESQSEIVRVVGLTNLTNPNDPKGYRIEVIRAQEGTTARDNHPDECILIKLVKQPNASFITGRDANNDGVIDLPLTGITAGTSNVRIGVAEFGGILTTQDYLRLSGNEIVKVVTLASTDIQSLIVTDGGSPETQVFKVESTTGNTFVNGDLNVGAGFNKFTVQGTTGNTNVKGTLTVENTLKINGATVPNTEFFTITNGGSTTVPLRTTFQIDTATGDVTLNGGSIRAFGTDGTTPRLTFDNSSGDFTVYGSFSALGTGVSTFGGGIKINTGGLDIKFRPNTDSAANRRLVIKNNNNTELFAVESDGATTIAGIDNYITRTGGLKWLYADGVTIQGLANRSYFVNASQNTLFKLPQNPLIGDMIRIIDVGGNLTYNLTLVVRAPDSISVQNADDNTGNALLSGVPNSDFTGYNGGELVVQTPYAAFALVYAGTTYPNGNQAVPTSFSGWYLMEV